MEIKRLSKADILRGTDQAHSFYVEELGGELELHPLTEGQYAQVEGIRGGGIKLSGGAVMDENGNMDRTATGQNMRMEIDMEESLRADFEADCAAVAHSLSNREEKWDPSEVMVMRPPGVVAKIAREVYRISGVSPQKLEQVHSFRDQPRRTRNRVVASDRVAASAHAVGTDVATKGVPGGSAAPGDA